MIALLVGIVVITILMMVVRGGKVSEAQAADLWNVREE